MIYSIVCFQKVFKNLNVKVVPNHTFKFGAERVKRIVLKFKQPDSESSL